MLRSSKIHHHFRASLLACSSCALLASAVAPQRDASQFARIRDEAFNRSQILTTVSYLSDVVGPRLTGSPNIKRAQEYAVGKLREWGLADAHLEPWGPFGRGWSLERFTANMLSPGFSPLIAYPAAWSPGTNGTIRGQPVFLDVKTEADLEKYKGKLKGKIVLFSPPREVDPLFEPPARRQSDQDLARLAAAPPAPDPRSFQYTLEQRAAAALSYAKWRFFEHEGAAVVLQPSYRDAGTVYVTAATVPYPPDVPFNERLNAWSPGAPAILPQANVSAEQYNRVARLISQGVAVQLEINVAVRFYDVDPMSANVIAEIPGTDLKDEVVMLGGSIDSWHAATGATDNAVGAATALEVIRILQALGVEPRRTIRIGLWSAEEQGALGSHAYVAAHLGRKIPASENQPPRIETQPEYNKFDAYFNFDYGTGRIRGIYLQGNRDALPFFKPLVEPFEDLGASTLSLAGVGAADHISFDEIGVPGFQWIRDYMEGANTRAPHTNMDTYDHVLGDDLKQCAAVSASLIYTLSMSDERVPRKPLPAQ